MKEFYPFFRVALLSLLLNYSQAQTFTAHPGVDVSANSHGFYEYLPQGYSTSGSQTYPLILFFHGSSEVGNGTTDLSTVLRNGIPRLMNQNQFPVSFTVNGHTYSFIVLCPQYTTYPYNPDVESTLEYAIQHYRVDLNHVYLTGLSAGGIPVWDYPNSSLEHANRIAAIVPICGAYGLTGAGPQNIASSHLPVLATHNLNDPTVPSSTTVNNVNAINNTTNPPPNPAAISIIFNASGHDAWTQTYDPNEALIGGLNVYQWMLQFQRNIVSVPLPVKLTNYSARAAGSTAVVEWTTASEENNRYFILERSGDGQQFSAIDTIAAAGHGGGGASYRQVDERPLAGVNFYRLVQVDLDGKANYFDVLTVNFAAGNVTLRLSPNPSPGAVYLEMGGSLSGLLQVRLSDQQGKVLKNWSFRKQAGVWKQAIDPGSMPPGVYFITVEGNGLKEVRQFVRQ